MPTGVMNIKHLLCYPACDDDIFTTSTSILIQKSKKVEQPSSTFDFSNSSSNNSNNSNRLSPYTTTSNELPILYEFSRHSRSNSIRSVSSSSCSSTSSSGISDITTNITGGDSYFYSSTPNNNPTTSGKRQRVNSDLCRSSTSLNNSVNAYHRHHQQYYNLVLPERTVSCSPQQQSRKSSANAIKYRNRCNSTSSHIQTRTPWTPEEDGLLQKGYEQGLSWAMISATYLPHRSRGCCWGRFKTLQSKNLIGVYQQRICQRPWKSSNQQH